jgi:hypothetical protein
MLEVVQLLTNDVSRLKGDCERLNIDIFELVEMNRLLEGTEPTFLAAKETLYLTKGLTVSDTRAYLIEASRRTGLYQSTSTILQGKEQALLKPTFPHPSNKTVSIKPVSRKCNTDHFLKFYRFPYVQRQPMAR